MDNTFLIDIADKSVTKLSGNTLGRSIYDEQVKEKIEFNGKMTFIFPERIDMLGSSFIQGFFYDIVGKIGIQGVEERVEVVAQNIENINNIVLQALLSMSQKGTSLP